MAKQTPVIHAKSGNESFFERLSVTDMQPETMLVVEDYQNAVLIKNGVYLETLGAGAYPAFDKKTGIFGKTKKEAGILSVDIVYVSKTVRVKVLWGTRSQFDFRDDETGVPVKVGASGEFEVQVNNPKKFYLSLVGADKNFDVERLKDRLSGRMMSEIEPAIAKTMREQKISYTRIAEYKPQVASGLLPEIRQMFEGDYGLTIFSFTLSKVIIADESIAAIEVKREQLSREEKEKAQQDADKLTAKEIAAEMERLSDKQFEREVLMKKLETVNYDKYLEVCKIIGWDPQPKTAGGKTACPKCGGANTEGTRFCGHCGTKLVKEPVKCKCGTVNGPDAKFCNNCGEKL